MSLDTTVAQALHRRAVAGPGLVRVSRVLTDRVWDPWAMRALTAVVVAVLWWRGSRLLAGWVAATSLLATLVQQGLKAAVGRERPRWPDPVASAQYAAFPSGHAMTAVVTCGLLLWLLRLHGARSLVWWGSLVLAVISVAACVLHTSPPGGALAERCTGRSAAGRRRGRVLRGRVHPVHPALTTPGRGREQAAVEPPGRHRKRVAREGFREAV